jgi:putative ABC transport system permease protein
VLLSPGADPAILQSKLPALIQKYEGGELKNRKYKLYLVAGAGHVDLPAFFLRCAGQPASLDNVHILTVIGIFILLIAAVNFINLSTARSVERAKEVGIRKCAGAKRVS